MSRLQQRPKRVRWLAPSVLAQGLAPIYLSGIFARFSDRREVEAVLPQGILDFSEGQDDLWIDYVADTGDGFDATMSVASLLATETRDVAPFDGKGEPTPTKAGAVLVLGGDEVYPYASQRQYQRRFLDAFRGVFPFAEPQRTVVALPGNHDWYDGLTSFLQVFCGRGSVGGWKTAQRRSYFACKLPHRWWLWGVDIQLDTYIDQPQLEYFLKAAEQIHEGDGVILCWAKPSWVKEGEEKTESYKVLEYFQRTILPDHAHLRVSLTGDSHHYARYEGPNGEQKITAGLGGAFLSATHHLPETLRLPAVTGDVEPTTYTRRSTYPTEPKSKALRRGVLCEIYRNDGYALLPAAAYGAVALAWRRRRLSVASVAATAGIFVGCVAFSKAKKPSEAGPGLLHGCAHLATVAALVRVSSRLGGRRASFGTAAGVAGAGALIGPLVLSLYLLAVDSLGLFSRNTNELFAAQAIEDYKGFLRLHVSKEFLRIYPIKIDKIARWTEDGTWPAPVGGPRFRPDRLLTPELIEPVIEVTRTP